MSTRLGDDVAHWAPASRVKQSAILLLAKQAARLPRGMADRLLGGVGIVASVAQPTRLARAYTWAGAYGHRGPDRRRVMLSVLAHRGHALVDAWTPAFESAQAFRDRVRFDGREHLDAVVGRPSILLGFHLGSPLARWALAAHGYDCAVAAAEGWGVDSHAPLRAGWRSHADLERVTVMPRDASARSLAVALHRVRALLTANRTVRMVGDGTTGRELFRVPVPTGALVVRAGWWLLRRQTGAITVPVLTYRDRSVVVVRSYPPLPAPSSDPVEDTERCRAVLVPLVQEFVRDHPDQCLPWVFDAASGT